MGLKVYSFRRRVKNYLAHFTFKFAKLLNLNFSSKLIENEIKLQFSSQAEAVNYAKKNNISYYIIDPQKRKFVKKSYSDNFIKK